MHSRVSHRLPRITRHEPWIITGLLVLAIASMVGLILRFYRSTTLLVPGSGGTYIEGSIGTLQPLNPWFTIQNDVNRDIVSLIFAGLLKYNPETRKVEEDLATMKVTGNGRIYTFTLRDNLYWHDATAEDPHPVTADDVMFTYTTLQDPKFPNPLLRQNFQGVTVEKINDKTIQFRLDKPYAFFPSNVTLGLLPKRSFEGVPIDRLDQTVDFGFAPVGAGPYKVIGIIQTDLSTEVTLERFDRPLEPRYRLDRIVLRMFPDYFSLLSDLRNLNGIRTVPRNDNGEPVVPRRLIARQYSLPQYVALFFNLDRRILQDVKLRLGLQLGTNKQELVDAIHESVIVDTPLLEIDGSDWRYSFNPDAAQGALFESEWYFPEKVRLQRLLEQRDANRTGPLKMYSPIALLDTGAILTFTGSLTKESLTKSFNGIRLKQHPTMSGAWIVQLPTAGGTGSLAMGQNLIRITDAKGKVLDSFYLRRFTDASQYRRASEEQRLVELFIRSRAGEVPQQERITVGDLAFDHGFLRRRTGSDVIGQRINDAGQPLTLTLLTSASPPQYRILAEQVAEQWKALGVHVNIQIPEAHSVFEERMLKRDYDVLLFGQSLLDNLDSYPYWHSSGLQRLTGKRSDLRLDAYNLSQYSSFEADAELETIRETTDDIVRAKALKRLDAIFRRDVPAVFLYSPLYTFAHTPNIQGIAFHDLSLHSDRFLTLANWYVHEERKFPEGKNWLSFLPWLLHLLFDNTADTTATPSDVPQER